MRSIRRVAPPTPTVPGLRAVRDWRHLLGGDAPAGLAVAAYLVPQCMAYAALAGLPAVNGLWAALAALVLYAFLGTSSRLSVGPESASALLVGSVIASIGTGADQVDRTDVAAALAIAVAAIALVAWSLRLGFLADLLSRPVLLGYMAGVAIVMIVSQLPNITNITTSETGTLRRAVDVLSNLDELDPAPFLLAMAVVAALVVARRWPRVPGPLVVMLAATAATSIFDLQSHGVATIGDVPQGVPSFKLPGIPADVWPQIFIGAVGISVVVFTDIILTARAFAAKAGDQIDPNQELFALAGANSAVGVFGGFPVSSSGSRTAVADSAGARSQLTSLVAAAVVVLVLVAGGVVLESFPLAALGGLVIYAACQLIDVPEIRRVARFRRTEGLLVLAAFAGVVFFGVLSGIAIAVGLSVAELFARISRAHDAIEGSVPGLAGLHDVDDYPDAVTVPGLVVYRYDAPLCFANAEDYRARVLEAVDAEEAPVEWVLLNVEANVEIDLTATDMLEDLRSDLEQRGIALALARVKHDLAVYLERAGLIERVGADHVFLTLPTALEAFHHRHDVPEPPPPARAAE
jgi:high affinity sulfate transporter 1